MKRSTQLLGAVSSFALVAFSASPALAAGTTAGSTITNNVTVDFQVGGVQQTAATATNTFTVDRKVNVLVATSDAVTTQVSPGETTAVTTFDVTNLSNAVVDLGLAVAQPTSDNFNVTNVQIYRDNGDGVFNSATDTLVTYLDEVAADETIRVFVVGDIPSTTVTGNVSQVVLTATAEASGSVGSEGAVLTATAGADTSGVDTVLADLAGSTDSNYDGTYSATDSYTVSAAALSAVKSMRIIDDPVNGTTNPKAIPGATIEYCIAVSNASGSATATNVNVTDVLPGDVTYDAGFGIFVDGTVDGSNVCQADGVAGGSFAAGTVSGTLSNIAASVTRTLYFRATIN
ncbi:MAG: hypothetical protein R3E14_00775 [Erythrobacter sp.]